MKKDMKEVLAEADYVSLNMPLTGETKGLINKNSLAMCKDGCYIINTGRGKCVVEEDVVDALNTGKLSGYGNDVWYSDPPEDSPLVKHPNVVMTPHIGASTRENLLRIGEIIDQLIGQYVKK
jgi:D-3-phosphoglycerate dehydrogenase